jgi:hypothetical protein
MPVVFFARKYCKQAGVFMRRLRALGASAMMMTMDKSRVYYGIQVLEDVEASSFVALADGWGKDPSRVFYQGLVIEGGG